MVGGKTTLTDLLAAAVRLDHKRKHSGRRSKVNRSSRSLLLVVRMWNAGNSDAHDRSKYRR